MQSPSGVNQSIEGNRKPSFTSRNEKTAQLGIGVLAGYSWNGIYDLFGTYKSDASSVCQVIRDGILLGLSGWLDIEQLFFFAEQWDANRTET